MSENDNCHCTGTTKVAIKVIWEGTSEEKSLEETDVEVCGRDTMPQTKTRCKRRKNCRKRQKIRALLARNATGSGSYNGAIVLHRVGLHSNVMFWPVVKFIGLMRYKRYICLMISDSIT